MRKVSSNPQDFEVQESFIDVYKKRPSFLGGICMIETTRSWSYDVRRKKHPWKPRKAHAIIRVWPRFHSVPKEDSEHFESFCWSELLLYKPFQNIEEEIGLDSNTIIENWRNLRYRAWHVDRAPLFNDVANEDPDSDIEHVNVDADMDELELLSRLVPPNNLEISEVSTLGRRDFYLSFNWGWGNIDDVSLE